MDHAVSSQFTYEYRIHNSTDALMSRDRTIHAQYDHAYVARYEKYPEQELSEIRAALFQRFFPDADIVCDIGYGTGAFLRAVNDRSPWVHCWGYDVSPYPAPSFVRVDPDWQRTRWPVLTFFDSLEHFDQLPRFEADGAIVSVPWYHPALGAEWFYNWKHRRPGEHLWHFTPETLANVMEINGLRPVFIGSPEDAVRKNDGDWPNILTMVFKA
jgi:hypothetical protein